LFCFIRYIFEIKKIFLKDLKRILGLKMILAEKRYLKKLNVLFVFEKLKTINKMDNFVENKNKLAFL
jgi:hypothetical protein